MSEGVWLRGGDGAVGLALVHVNEGDKVLVKPISSELEVVEWSTQEVETTSAVEVLEAQGILRGREGGERESLIVSYKNSSCNDYHQERCKSKPVCSTGQIPTVETVLSRELRLFHCIPAPLSLNINFPGINSPEEITTNSQTRR